MIKVKQQKFFSLLGYFAGHKEVRRDNKKLREEQFCLEVRLREELCFSDEMRSQSLRLPGSLRCAMPSIRPGSIPGQSTYGEVSESEPTYLRSTRNQQQTSEPALASRILDRALR